MKRIISIICLVALCVSLMSFAVSAASASVSANGPESVKVGESFNITVTLNGSDIHGLQGKINYDASAISINSVSCPLSGWAAETYGKNFVAYDNDGEHAINQSKTVLTISATLLAGTPGSKVTVTFGSLVATDAKNSLSVSDVTYALTVMEEPTEPTEPSTEATEPSTEATEPSTEATEPTTQPTEPTTRPTEPATTQPTESTTEATEAVTEGTEATTEATEPVDETEPEGEPTTEPDGEPTTEPDGDGEPENRRFPWWLILLIILTLGIAYIIWRRSKKNA